MIATLRRRHRRMTGVLALAMPPLLAAALWARPAPPRMDALPASLVAPAIAGGDPLWESDERARALPMRVRLFGGARPAVEIEPLRDPMLPDVLVYWSEGAAAIDAPLPDDARLVGRLAGTERRRFALPRASGSLVLLSLGHQRVVEAISLSN